jgi:transcriptional regulator of NAD metabolism
METLERREKIIELLHKSSKPLTGTWLANTLGVSRQAIVQDIAVLRASGHDLIATSQGYMLPKSPALTVYKRAFTCKHQERDMEDELMTIIDMGGRILDVSIEHKVYGEFKGKLMIKSPSDIRKFIERMKHEGSGALSTLTGGIHLHTVEADSESILDDIEKSLKRKGYLIP